METLQYALYHYVLGALIVGPAMCALDSYETEKGERLQYFCRFLAYYMVFWGIGLLLRLVLDIIKAVHWLRGRH